MTPDMQRKITVAAHAAGEAASSAMAAVLETFGAGTELIADVKVAGIKPSLPSWDTCLVCVVAPPTQICGAAYLVCNICSLRTHASFISCHQATCLCCKLSCCACAGLAGATATGARCHVSDLRTAFAFKLAGSEAAAAQATASDPVLQEAAAVLRASGYQAAGMSLLRHPMLVQWGLCCVCCVCMIRTSAGLLPMPSMHNSVRAARLCIISALEHVRMNECFIIDHHHQGL